MNSIVACRGDFNWRSAIWSAHVIEERFALAAPKPALYRPGSDYAGDYCGPAECAFVPLEQR